MYSSFVAYKLQYPHLTTTSLFFCEERLVSTSTPIHTRSRSQFHISCCIRSNSRWNHTLIHRSCFRLVSSGFSLRTQAWVSRLQYSTRELFRRKCLHLLRCSFLSTLLPDRPKQLIPFYFLPRLQSLSLLLANLCITFQLLPPYVCGRLQLILSQWPIFFEASITLQCLLLQKFWFLQSHNLRDILNPSKNVYGQYAPSSDLYMSFTALCTLHMDCQASAKTRTQTCGNGYWIWCCFQHGVVGIALILVMYYGSNPLAASLYWSRENFAEAQLCCVYSVRYFHVSQEFCSGQTTESFWKYLGLLFSSNGFV